VRSEKIANSVGAGYDGTTRGPGMFLVSGVPTAGRSAAEVEQALRRELTKVVTDGVSDEELKRVKAQVVSSQVFQRDSIVFQARQIGSLEIAGYSHRTIDLMIRKLQAVTAAQVQEVAKKYLLDDALTVAVLDPQPLEGRRPAAAPAGVRHAQ
jgi:zinc protease